MSAPLEALEPGCEPRCPGCAHRLLSAEESLAQKARWLQQALAAWKDRLEPIRSEARERRWGYRTKATLRARWNGGSWDFGFLRRIPGSFDLELIAIPGCPLHAAAIRSALTMLATRLPPQREFPLAFVSFAGGLVTLVVKHPLSGAPALETRLKESGVLEDLGLLGFSGAFLNFNPSAGNRVLAQKGWRHLWGESRGTLRFDAGTMELVHGPSSFQQLLPDLYRASLDEAREFLRPSPGSRVLDLCSGIGTSLRLWQRAGAQTLGIELSGEAVECAGRNAGSGACLQGKVSERLPQIDSWFGSHSGGPLLAYMNPPRTGVEREVLEWIARRAEGAGRFERMAYLSCNARSLAEDLCVLEKAGYAVRRIIPYDFFPQTHHVESLVLLGYGA